MPASPSEAYWNFREALNRPTPTLFFEDRSIHPRTGELAGESRRQARRDSLRPRLTIVGAGRAAALAEDAADALAKQGHGASVKS